MPRGRILCVSFDKTVSESRCFALREAGYDVVATTNIQEAFNQLDQIKFDLVIVGHRFEKLDKQTLISEARQRWHTPVVLMCGASPDSELEADARVFAIQGTDGLLEAVAKLMRGAVAA
jgi:DNA-binding response OmpR family regulator